MENLCRPRLQADRRQPDKPRLGNLSSFFWDGLREVRLNRKGRAILRCQGSRLFQMRSLSGMINVLTYLIWQYLFIYQKMVADAGIINMHDFPNNFFSYVSSDYMPFSTATLPDLSVFCRAHFVLCRHLVDMVFNHSRSPLGKRTLLAGP